LRWPSCRRRLAAERAPPDVVDAHHGRADQGGIDVGRQDRPGEDQRPSVALELLDVPLGERLRQVDDARGLEAKVLERLAEVRARRLVQRADVHVPAARRRGMERAGEEAAVELREEDVLVEGNDHGERGVEAPRRMRAPGLGENRRRSARSRISLRRAGLTRCAVSWRSARDTVEGETPRRVAICTMPSLGFFEREWKDISPGSSSERQLQIMTRLQANSCKSFAAAVPELLGAAGAVAGALEKRLKLAGRGCAPAEFACTDSTRDPGEFDCRDNVCII
jgi:hypothetical protein